MSQTRRTLVAGLAMAFVAVSGLSTPPARGQDLKEVRIGFQKAEIFPAVKQRRTLEEALKSRGVELK